jgi:serine/threonine protein phosphatase 1
VKPLQFGDPAPRFARIREIESQIADDGFFGRGGMQALQRLFQRFSRNRSPYDGALFPPRAPAPSDVVARPAVLPRYRFTDTTVQIAAIGDIHGRTDLLEKLQPVLDAAAADQDRRLIEIYMGDYVDHAGDPRGVLDYLVARLRLTDRDVICLAGNHEEMLLEAMKNDKFFTRWLRYGGDATMKSYGVSCRDAMHDPQAARMRLAASLPPEHLQFLQNLRPSYSRGGFFFAHAGIRPGVPVHEQVSRDLLWIREPFLSNPTPFGATVVHGHTPNQAAVLRSNRIGIDTGAYLTGRLTCLLINSETIQLHDTGAS